MKRFLSLFLAFIVAVGICLSAPMTIEAEAATFEDINNSSVFVKQQTNYTCTLASAVMLVRRAAMLTGNNNWASITENSMRGTAWLEGSGLYYNFTYAGVSVKHASLPTGSSNTATLINLLASHPEGIILYYHNSDYSVAHAVLLTDYTNGVFYCADPAKVNGVENGRIPISKAWVVTISNANEYWYVSSPKCTLGTPTTGITLNTTAKTLKIGDSLTLTATVTPSNATNKTVTWSSSNTKVATVSNGVVKAVANGVVDITAKASGGQTVTCTVVVAPTTLTPTARTVIGNNVYEFYKEDYIGNDASAYAKNRGGYLVTLTSEEERNLVYNWVKSLAPSAIAISTGGYRTGEKTFGWESGEAWSYAPWVSGEPNNTNGVENRAIMVMDSGNWNDISGAKAWPFVIEYSLDTYKSKGYNVEGIPVLKLPSNPDMSNYKKSTLYRYADKQFTTSQSETLSGWTKYDSKTTYGDWGSVKTTMTKPTESANLKITGTQQYHKYYHYWNYYSGSNCIDSISYGTNKGYHEIFLTYKLSAVSMADQGGKQAYGSFTCSKDNFNFWFYAGQVTQYSYQERTVTGTNYFYKWGNWSDWSTTPVTANDNRKVETQTSYTLTTHTHTASDWVATKNPTCTVEGTKVKKCTSCGEVMQTASIPVTSHTKSGWIVDKAATVTELGSKHIECTVCKKVLETGTIDKLPLSAPTTSASNTQNGIKVTWNAVEGAESYKVFRRVYNESTKTWGGWTNLTTGCTATSYTDTLGNLGVTYSYAVVAVNGSISSNYVASASIKCNPSPKAAIQNTTDGIKVEWNKVFGATSYKVFRRELNTSNNTWSAWTSIASGFTGSALVDKTAKLGVTYSYAVVAVNSTASSNYVATEGLKADITTVVTATSTSSGINLKWNKVNGATGYTIYRKAFNATNNTWSSWSVLKTGYTGTSYNDTIGNLGVSYIYCVRATVGSYSGSYVQSSEVKCSMAPKVTITNTAGGINVEWSKVFGATSYKVFRRELNTSNNTWSAWASIASGLTTTSYVDKTAKFGVTYSYAVVATNGSVSSGYIATSGLKCNIAPTVTIANGTDGIRVNWNKINGATSYKVFRRELNTANNTWSAWSSPASGLTTTSYVDKTAKLGSTYSYAVVASNSTLSSSHLASASLKCSIAPTVTIANGAEGIKVTWNKINGATSYKVFRRELNTSNNTWSAWSSPASGLTNTIYIDKTASLGTTYSYAVVASNNSGSSGYIATTGLKCNIAPTVTIANSTEGIKVTWNKINGAVTYKVFRRQLNADNTWGAWSSPASGLTTTSYVDKNAKFGTKYSYAVVAVNNSISSSFVATAALQCGTAPKVTIGSDAKGIRINWSTVSGADSYIVYKKIYNTSTNTWSDWKTVTQGAKGTTTVDTGVVNGTYYMYTVRASKDGFNGAFVQSNVAKYVK